LGAVEEAGEEAMMIAFAIATGFLLCGTFLSADANWSRLSVRERIAACISIGAGVVVLVALAVR
jgi:uncharacterized membrane protein